MDHKNLPLVKEAIEAILSFASCLSWIVAFSLNAQMHHILRGVGDGVSGKQHLGTHLPLDTTIISE